jgi:hypothetical protein
MPSLHNGVRRVDLVMEERICRAAARAALTFIFQFLTE